MQLTQVNRHCLHVLTVAKPMAAPTGTHRTWLVGLQHTQELVIWKDCIAFAVRPSTGEWLHLRICVDTLNPEQLSISDYLEFKERIVGAMQSYPSILISCCCSFPAIGTASRSPSGHYLRCMNKCC